ncbi:MAG: hypothetical protein ABJF10_23930 [Chthoniobacter sp.]|uniref:hypothetical protein n=1 Tax=Chthoniobacter sp. TaxID=2510640 RepID=UPI0032A56983
MDATPAHDHGTSLSSSRLLTRLSSVGAIFSIAVLLALLYYKHGNDSNHTGFEPWLLSIVFVPTAAVGIAAVYRNSSRPLGIFACCVGIGCMVFLFYLDYFNILVQYERWIARGMP